MAIELFFADGSYCMELTLAGINEIEKKCESGLGAVFARLLQGRFDTDEGQIGHNGYAAWKIQDIIEPIRQGLIGGGKCVVDGVEAKVSSHRANELIAAYVLSKPLAQSWSMAVAIMTACVDGYEPPKKAEPVAPAASRPRRKRKASSAKTDMPAP